jgi:hypothetical protein
MADLLTAAQRMNKLLSLDKAVFGAHVEAVWGKSEDPTIVLLRETYGPSESDTINERILKKLGFYLDCGKLPSLIEEHLVVNEKTAAKDPLMLRAQCAMRPELRYVTRENGKSYQVGNRRIDIPHIVENQCEELRGLHLTYGQRRGLYIFADGTQIKVNCITEKEAHRVINHCLKAVDPQWLKGSSEDHTYFGKSPKTAKKSPLHDTRSDIQAVYIHNQYGKVQALWV